MSLESYRLVLLAVLLVFKCAMSSKFSSSGFKDAGLTNTDLKEIHRQNQITKQILQNFLETSLYGKRLSNPPSLLEILPTGAAVVRRSPSNNIQELLGNSTSHENDNGEILDSDRTENIYSYFEDFDDEGNP